MNSNKVILSVLTGVAVGAIMGVLLAPQKGSKTRRQIIRNGDDLADDAKEMYEDITKTISKKYNCTRSEAEELISQFKAKFAGVKKEENKVVS